MAVADSEKLRKLSTRQIAVLMSGNIQQILADKEILSCLTGRLGPYIIRHQNGRPVLSRRARSFRPSQSHKAVYFRNKFAAAQRFASFINGIDILARVWEDPNVPRYNKIIKQNVVKCGEFWPTARNIITPVEYDFTIEEARITRSFLSLKIDRHYTFSESDVLKIILMAYDPVREDDKKFELMEVSPAYSLFGTAVNLTHEQTLLCMKYKKTIYYIAVIKCGGNELKWSNTYAVKAGSFYN